LPHVDRQAFPREQIEHRQCAEASSIGDEIHTPNVVASDRWSSLLPMDGGGMSPRTLPSERQALLAYRGDSIASSRAPSPGVARARAVDDTQIARVSVPARASAAAVQSGDYDSSDSECWTNRNAPLASLAHLVAAHQVAHDFTLLDGLQTFF
jgi:hypothetical protein